MKEFLSVSNELIARSGVGGGRAVDRVGNAEPELPVDWLNNPSPQISCLAGYHCFPIACSWPLPPTPSSTPAPNPTHPLSLTATPPVRPQARPLVLSALTILLVLVHSQAHVPASGSLHYVIFSSCKALPADTSMDQSLTLPCLSSMSLVRAAFPDDPHLTETPLSPRCSPNSASVFNIVLFHPLTFFLGLSMFLH